MQKYYRNQVKQYFKDFFIVKKGWQSQPFFYGVKQQTQIIDNQELAALVVAFDFCKKIREKMVFLGLKDKKEAENDLKNE